MLPEVSQELLSLSTHQLVTNNPVIRHVLDSTTSCCSSMERCSLAASLMLQTVQIPPCTTVLENIKYSCCIVVTPAVFSVFITIKLCLT